MKNHVFHAVWCYISDEAAGEIWNWSLSGVRGFNCSLLVTPYVLAKRMQHFDTTSCNIVVWCCTTLNRSLTLVGETRGQTDATLGTTSCNVVVWRCTMLDWSLILVKLALVTLWPNGRNMLRARTLRQRVASVWPGLYSYLWPCSHLVPEHDYRWALMWAHVFSRTHPRSRERCPCPSSRSRPCAQALKWVFIFWVPRVWTQHHFVPVPRH